MNKYNPNTHHRRSIRLKGYDYSQAGLYFITICCENRKYRFGKIENNEMILNELGNIAYDEWVKLAERFPKFELDVFQIMPNHIHGVILLNGVVGAGFTPAQNTDTQNNDNTIEQPEIGQPEIGKPKIGQPEIGQLQNGQPENGQPEIEQPEIGQTEIEQPQNGQPEIGQTEIGQLQNGQPEIGQPQGIAPTTTSTVGDIIGAYKSLVANGCLEIFKSKNKIMGKLWQRNFYENIIRNPQSYQRISDYIINNPAKWSDDKFYGK